MFRTLTKVALAAFILCAAGVYAPAIAHPSIDLTASNWKFTPNAIVLHVGETTQLRITATEGVHGIKSDELGIPQTVLPPGKVVTIDVTPKKVGTYILHCTIMCGPGHDNMTLTIKVEEK